MKKRIVRVDASLPALLAHRGASRHRAAAIILDLGHDRSAETELDRLLPTEKETSTIGGTIRFHAVLDEHTVWTGTHLQIAQELPEAVVAALSGRTLRQVVDHPALPDRLILSAERIDDIILIQVEGDARPTGEIAPRSWRARLLRTPTRLINLRQRRMEVSADAHQGWRYGAIWGAAWGMMGFLLCGVLVIGAQIYGLHVSSHASAWILEATLASAALGFLKEWSETTSHGESTWTQALEDAHEAALKPYGRRLRRY